MEKWQREQIKKFTDEMSYKDTVNFLQKIYDLSETDDVFNKIISTVFKNIQGYDDSASKSSEIKKSDNKQNIDILAKSLEETDSFQQYYNMLPKSVENWEYYLSPQALIKVKNRAESEFTDDMLEDEKIGTIFDCIKDEAINNIVRTLNSVGSILIECDEILSELLDYLYKNYISVAIKVEKNQYLIELN